MAYEFELKYPLADPGDVSEKSLIETAARRLSVAETFALEGEDYYEEIGQLTSDAYLIIRAAQAIAEGEDVHDTGEESETLEQSIEFADMLNAAINVNERNSLLIVDGALHELSLGLENLLRRLNSTNQEGGKRRFADPDCHCADECNFECDCRKCISLDEDMKMLSDNFYTSAGKENIRDLRRASFNHPEEFGKILREFVDSHTSAQSDEELDS